MDGDTRSSSLGAPLDNGLWNGPLGGAMKPIVASSKINNNVVLFARFDSDISDSSRSNLNLIRNGNARIVGFSRVGDGSAIFSASGDFISIANSPILGLGVENFTIEMWAFRSAAMVNWSAVFELGTGINPYTNGLMIRLQSTNNDPLYIAGTAYAWNPAANFPLNRWNHLALVRNGNIFTIYINGISVFSTVNSANLGSSSSMYIGNSIHSNGSQALGGNIDEFIITKGVAKYISNFIPQ
jgi:hypothetical protein